MTFGWYGDVHYALSLALNTDPTFDGEPQQRPTAAGGHQRNWDCTKSLWHLGQNTFAILNEISLTFWTASLKFGKTSLTFGTESLKWGIKITLTFGKQNLSFGNKEVFQVWENIFLFCGITFLRRFETTILLGANMYLAEQWHCVLRFPENADVVHNMKWNEHLSKQSICISIEIERIYRRDKTWLIKKKDQICIDSYFLKTEADIYFNLWTL